MEVIPNILTSSITVL